MTDGVGGIRAYAAAVLLTAAWTGSAPAQAPGSPMGARVDTADTTAPGVRYPLTVRVRQVAGSNVYLDAGTDHGLARGDTLPVLRDGATQPAGRLVVVAVSTSRSVLRNLDEAVEYRSGVPITLYLRRRPSIEVAADGAGDGRTAGEARTDGSGAGSEGRTARGGRTSGAQEARTGASPRAYGSVTMDLSARHSITDPGGRDGDRIDRTYATPGFRASVTAPDVLGGFRLRTRLRLSYRYSDRDLVASAMAARVNTLSLERTFERVPVDLELGRFRGPGGLFGGYWDGVRARLGGTGLGVGAMVGFQPDLWNAAPSSDIPKAAVYVDWRRGSGRSSWSGDLSIHATWPVVDGMADHTFLGLDQTVRLGRFRLNHEVQVDQEPDGGWSLGRLRLLGMLTVSDGVRLRIGGIRTRRWSLRPVADPLGPRHDRYSVGLSARPAGARVSLDASLSRREDGRETRGLTGRVTFPTLAVLGGMAPGGSVSWWDGDDGHTLIVAPDLSLRTPLRTRLAYRYYRSAFGTRTSTSHSLDGRLDVPLADRLTADIGLGVRWGEGLRSDRLSIVLHRRF